MKAFLALALAVGACSQTSSNPIVTISPCKSAGGVCTQSLCPWGPGWTTSQLSCDDGTTFFAQSCCMHTDASADAYDEAGTEDGGSTDGPSWADGMPDVVDGMPDVIPSDSGDGTAGRDSTAD